MIVYAYVSLPVVGSYGNYTLISDRVRTGGETCPWFNTIARFKKIESVALTVNTIFNDRRK